MGNFSKLFEKYKTYDDSNGRGSVKEWRESFESKMGLDEAQKIIKNNDPLIVLGFSQMPDLSELKTRYRKLVMENHPDKGGSTILCKKIIAAFTVLEKRLRPHD